ncbi:hypothetical protein SNK03_13616 [Fusarium graminearum]
MQPTDSYDIPQSHETLNAIPIPVPVTFKQKKERQRKRLCGRFSMFKHFNRFEVT